MRRFIAVALTLITLFSVAIPCIAVTADTIPGQSKIVKSTIDVPVGSKVNATFICNTTGNGVALNKGTKSVASMNDNGKSGDMKRADGIFSATVTLSSNERGTQKYTAIQNNTVVAEYTVNFYNELTAKDFTEKESIYSKVADIESTNKSKTQSQVTDAVYSYLINNKSISNVVRTGDVISYQTSAGITCVYNSFDGNTKGTSPVTLSPAGDIVEAEEDIISWNNPNVLLMRPFRNGITDNSAGFNHDSYITPANTIAKKTGGEIIKFDDEEANPYNLINNLYKVGFFLVDSHGLDINVGGEMKSTIIMNNVNNDGITSADWSAGRVVDLYQDGLVAVSGDYIKARYEEENKRLDNTVCYLGICLGMKYDSLKVPLTEIGAKLVIGYTEVVSIVYDTNMLSAMTKKLSKAKDDTRSFTFGESIEYAKSQAGDVDPGGSGAIIVTYGNTNIALITPDNIATSLSFENSKHEGIVNQYTYVKTTVMSGSKYAQGFNQEWTSSNENVAKVVAPQLVLGVGEGKADITCKVTGNGYSFEKKCTITISFVEAESIKLTIKKSSFYTSENIRFTCTVYPRTASNREYKVYSTNPGSVALSGNTMMPVAPGNTTIWAETANKKLTATKNINVNNKNVYQLTKDLSDKFTYVIAARSMTNGYMLMSATATGNYLKPYSIDVNNGYISASITGNKTWKLIPSSNGYYIYNVVDKVYLSYDGSDKIALDKSPVTEFITEGNRLKALITTDDVNCYLRYTKDKGFCFGKKSSAVNVEFYRCMEFGNSEMFNVVAFATDTDSYSQTIEIGKRATAVVPMPVSGKTFLGWDKPLNKVDSPFTTNALYREGETDKVVITFLHLDGTVIATQEYNSGEKIAPPTADEVLNGNSFSGWSEQLGKATQNMTVFALYTECTLGDVTGDSLVNTGDAVTVLKYAAGMITLSDAGLSAADVTKDGTVNTGDAVTILKFAAGMIDKF